MKKICVYFTVLCILTALSTLITIHIKQTLNPTATYIFNCQTRQISPDNVIGLDEFQFVDTVSKTDKYKVRLVPISTINEYDVVAFSSDNKQMQYGVVSTVFVSENGVVTLYVPCGNDDYLHITSKEFRGIVQKK